MRKQLSELQTDNIRLTSALNSHEEAIGDILINDATYAGKLKHRYKETLSKLDACSDVSGVNPTYINPITQNPIVRYNLFVEQTKSNYVEARKTYKKAIIHARLNFNAEYISSASNSCKAAWEIINRYKGSSNACKISHNLTPDDFNYTFIATVKEACSQAPPSLAVSGQLVSGYQVPPLRFVWKLVSSEEVLKCVQSIKSSSSKDIFDISVDLVKFVLPVILEPLMASINHCLSTGLFPDLLKLSKVVPIFKKGDPSLAENYRPISVVPTFSKIIEKAVIYQVSEVFESNSLFSKNQFGFRKGLSTVGTVELLVSGVIGGFEHCSSTLASLCDLTKAFDCAPHDILLNKLQHYGLNGVELNFFRTYLSDRTQRVYFNNTLSEAACKPFKLRWWKRFSSLRPIVPRRYNNTEGFVKGKSLWHLIRDDVQSILLNKDANSAVSMLQAEVRPRRHKANTKASV
ncbi:uncharacterized protein LOC124369464 [Homalodisca vitripennis]|uniref:uncharacterized protein LOC124369464 n=1 Tax=Homalodisca vitripennis TaxID=197043 RepID=UPI001EECB4F8|nr:uncharacterized protein LOC124369464 [Homalodisca vitripennis]